MTIRHALLVLLAAFAIRASYQALVMWMDGIFTVVDSGTYLAIAGDILETGRHARVIDGQIVPVIDRMPAYTYMLAGIIWLIGEVNHLAITTVQAAVDSLTVLATALAARVVTPRLTWPAAALGCLWPALVVYTSFVLTDTLFVMFFAWGLCACLWATRKPRVTLYLVAAGACFGLALVTRPILQFFPVFLFPALVYLLFRGLGAGWRRAIVMAAVPVVVMGLFAVPRLARTYDLYGSPVLSTQTGMHAMNFIYPCLKTPWSCAEMAAIKQRNAATVSDRLAKLPVEQARNPVIVDRIRRELALELILALPPSQIALGWAAGAAKGLFQTVFYEVGYQLKLSPQYFSSISGANLAERVNNFAKVLGENRFMVVWLIAQSLLLVSRLVQFGGCVGGLASRETRPIAVFLVVTAFYFLVVNGPVGYAKYRLPIEPALIIFLAMGGEMLWRKLTGRRVAA